MTPFRRILVRGIAAAGLVSAGLAVTALQPHVADAQSVVVDRGTFLLSRDGSAVGTEDFTIRRSGTERQPRLILTAEATIRTPTGERRTSSALEASGIERRITAYQIKESGERTLDVYLSLSGRRFQARVVTPQGEQLREYLAEPSVVILEEEMAHLYYLVAARFRDGSTAVPAVSPRSGTRRRLRIEDAGTEAVRIAERNIPARRLVVQDGDGAARDLWIDERGRVLRLVDRATGLRAERRDPPE